jgi:tRNA-dihydrouridine synthase
MLERTGCDGIMVARGGLGNPWIFREALDMASGRMPRYPAPEERCKVALRHLELFCTWHGARVALLEMRKHLCWYAKGVPGAAQFRAEVNRLQGLEEMIAAMRRFFHQEPT